MSLIIALTTALIIILSIIKFNNLLDGSGSFGNG